MSAVKRAMPLASAATPAAASTSRSSGPVNLRGWKCARGLRASGVPPVPGRDLPACHVYRTFDDLDAIAPSNPSRG